MSSVYPGHSDEVVLAMSRLGFVEVIDQKIRRQLKFPGLPDLHQNSLSGRKRFKFSHEIQSFIGFFKKKFHIDFCLKTGNNHEF